MLLFLTTLSLSLAYSYIYVFTENAITEAAIEKFFWTIFFLTVPGLFQTFSYFIENID